MDKITSQHSDQFYALTPNSILEAVEAAGHEVTGRYVQLNSYENRVFEIEREEGDPLIAKFYRPGRWSREALLEEHSFITELNEAGIPAIAPIVQENGTTLSEYENLWMCLFPKFFGRMPQELFQKDFQRIGRTLARLHNVGSQQEAKHRPFMTADEYGWPTLDLLADWVDLNVWSEYRDVATEILENLEDTLDPEGFIRIHGDCHKGNLLLNDIAGENQDFFFVDFDDFCNGPPAQDFWMLFSGGVDDTIAEKEQILTGYDELRSTEELQLEAMPALQGLRIIHYSGWIARRWEDPSFPQLFPQFREYPYWAEELDTLRKVASRLCQ